MRHGQSAWNKQNRFTGWSDVSLTQLGIYEARIAGQVLKEQGYEFDNAHTSMLTRAIQTFNFCATEMDQAWLPIEKNWRLNERHYGALQGDSKKQARILYGEEQVRQWRRSLHVLPPELPMEDERHPIHDRRYRFLAADCLPTGESLCTTLDRVLSYWHDTIVPQVKGGRNVFVVAHHNSLRAMVKQLSGMGEDDINNYKIPTAVPFVYEFDELMRATTTLPTYLIDKQEREERLKTFDSVDDLNIDPSI